MPLCSLAARGWGGRGVGAPWEEGLGVSIVELAVLMVGLQLTSRWGGNSSAPSISFF